MTLSVRYVHGTMKNLDQVKERGGKPADLFFNSQTGELYVLVKEWEDYPYSCFEAERWKTDLKIKEGFENSDLKSVSCTEFLDKVLKEMRNGRV